MAPSPKFWNRIAERYSKRPITDEAAYRKKLAITRGYFRPDMEVLEFGCGTGSTALLHAAYVKHIRAIDISAKMLEIARRKAAAENITNVAFDCAAIDDLRVAGQSLDAVLGFSILHLLENKEAVIGKVYDMLKPGGVFVTSTACLGDSMNFFKFIAPVGKFFGLMPLVRIFTAQELENSLKNAGFQIDHEWRPGKNKMVFIVAQKTTAMPSSPA